MMSFGSAKVHNSAGVLGSNVSATARSKLPAWEVDNGGTQTTQSLRGKLQRRSSRLVSLLRPKSACDAMSHNTRMLEWSAPVRSATLDLDLKVTLSAGQMKSRVASAYGQDTIPRCAIHVWVEGGPFSSKLAEVRGSVCPKNTKSALHVHWISRAKSAPGIDGDDWRFMELASQRNRSRPFTVAQALLGVLACIAEAFGMSNVELGAEDQGSCRLIQYYKDLGFQSTAAHTMFGELSMDAPLGRIVSLAPASWLQALPLTGWNAWGWLWGGSQRPDLNCILGLMGAPEKWEWNIAWPTGCQVELRAVGSSHDATPKVTVSAHLRSFRAELVYCRAVVRLTQSSARVIWLSRSGSKPADEAVRGRLLDGTAKAASDRKPTLAMALLGAVASLARWFGTSTLELTPVDDGSGKLPQYLCNFGFRPLSEAQGGESLRGGCKDLAALCPQAWRTSLPPDSQLSMLTKLYEGHP
ncbi:hypothetical protein AK812_SmicGene14330 [Symbiodinium microadriaticum]|uniref:Uncharacterized protein n=1 Tax=Symbiodinium microadriaticum TaxID=2951 RepID=A0A1Q9E5W0_SYMMI|nr:hypothetical protein AK812_SmicGene14330 [Symbiodinium microadriaticum]CAE7621221.1 unnamed protein product [Symbiodinium sp. KB8]